jgi:hypothetical protein
MNNLKVYILFFLLPLIFFTCQRSEIAALKEIVEIEINPDQSNPVPVLPLIKSMELVPLETNDNSLIGNVRNIKTDKRHIYILDYNDSPVKMFSNNGKFISEIGHKGGGPGEYIQMSDFFSDNDTVHVFAWSGNKKWIRYSQSNQFLYETDMTFPFDVICPLDNGDYLTYVSNGTVSNASDCYLYRINKKFEIQERLIPKMAPTDISLHITQNHLFQNSDYILCMKDYCDTIYKISHDLTIQPKYRLDFGKHWYSMNFLKENYNKSVFEIFNAINRNQYVKFIRFYENETHLTVSYSIYRKEKHENYIAIYWKDTGKTLNFKTSSQDVWVNLIAHPYATQGNQFLSLISVDELRDIASKMSSSDVFFDKVKQCAEHITESDNPVLVRYGF